MQMTIESTADLVSRHVHHRCVYCSNVCRGNLPGAHRDGRFVDRPSGVTCNALPPIFTVLVNATRVVYFPITLTLLLSTQETGDLIDRIRMVSRQTGQKTHHLFFLGRFGSTPDGTGHPERNRTHTAGVCRITMTKGAVLVIQRLTTGGRRGSNSNAGTATAGPTVAVGHR
jgi:hypothetical protein